MAIQIETLEDARDADSETLRPSSNRLWEALYNVLRPVLPSRIAEVLLSPVLIIEVVIRALLESGFALLLPSLAMAAVSGIAYWRLTPASSFAPTVASGAVSFLKPRLRPFNSGRDRRKSTAEL